MNVFVTSSFGSAFVYLRKQNTLSQSFDFMRKMLYFLENDKIASFIFLDADISGGCVANGVVQISGIQYLFASEKVNFTPTRDDASSRDQSREGGRCG